MESKFYSLEALVEKIEKSHKKLAKGKLNETGLNEFISAVRELEERLLIMRFKAYEGAFEQGELEEEKPTMAIDLRNQISLIDAIEEEVQKDHKPAAKKAEVKIEAAPKIEEKPTPKPEPKQEIPVEPKAEIKEVEEKIEAPINERIEREPSLNDRLSENKGEKSLNDRLKKTPIDDLKKSMGINQKYLFINELFKQNADHFNQTIEELNSCANHKEALSIIRGEIAPNYNWDEEDKNVTAFMDLVERRYLN